jgi:nitroreductase
LVICLEFMDVVRKRRSIRKYKPDPVPEAKLKHVLEAARQAPSWGNRQCWRYIIVSDEALRKKIVERATPAPTAARPRDWIAQAPIIIVGCADPTKSGDKEGKLYYLLDMGISIEHLILAAADEGLGTCWIGGGFDETIVKAALGVPKEIRVVALVPLGYPDEAPDPRARNSLEDITVKNHW